MAVQMSTNANVRADFMISDAALAQRNAEYFDKTADFEKMLAEVDKKMAKFADVKEAYDSGKFDVPTVEELERAGVVYTKEYSSKQAEVSSQGKFDGLSSKELARKLVSGEIKLGEVPAEMITFELFSELVYLRQTGFKEDDEEEVPAALRPAEDAVNREVTASLKDSGLIEAMKKLAESLLNKNGDVPEAAELEELDYDEEMKLLGELIMSIGQEYAVEEKVLESVRSAAVVKVEAAEEITMLIKSAGAEEVSDNAQTAQSSVPTAVTEVIPEAKEGNFDTFVRSEVKTDVSDVKIDADSVKTEDTGSIAAKASDSEPTADVSVRVTEDVSEIPEVVLKAAQDGELEKPVIRETRETAGAEKPAFTAAELTKQSDENAVKAVDERAKALGEELEMLKNARQKPQEDTETTEESTPKTEPTGAQAFITENIGADVKITLVKENGETTEVSRNALLEQVQKTVEAAVSENRGNTEYSLTLNPEELGKITVKLTKATDGGVTVTIVAESARTQRILEQNGELMQSNLKNGGVNLESWQVVQESQQEMYAQDYRGSAKNPYREQESEDEEQPEEGRSFAEIIAAM